MVKISVIIPTTCEARRAASLQRAIDSVLAQRGVEVELIIVVNGQRFEAERLEALRSDSALRAVYIETASPSVACRHGRAIATGEFFAFLDDDDEYLAGALATRLAPLASDPSIDIVVTNGYSGSGDRLQITRTAHIEADPLGAMLEENWLASCGALFRHRSCGDEFFADLPKYMEWTLLAFRLLLAGKRVKFVDTPTYRINDTPQSASKSREYRLASAAVIERLLSLPVPQPIRRRLRPRLLAARHDLSVMNLQEGRKAAAWSLHLQSLAGFSGLRYLTYTRRLLLRAFKVVPVAATSLPDRQQTPGASREPLTADRRPSTGKISVIIPTTCEARRAVSLQRAIDSVLSQQGVEVELIVVVNGQRFEPARLEALRRDPALITSYVETANLPFACRHGRSLASGEYFSFLDDDDEYLPDGLATRAAALQADPAIDLVVTNGYSNRADHLYLSRTADIESDPLAAMLEENWLASCGGLFRSASCGEELFADLPKYREWTLLAFRLLLAGKRMKFIDRPTYRINDSPESVSKSREYRLASAAVIESLLSLPLPMRIRRRLRSRLLAARHDLSVMNLEEGRRAAAWSLHLQSLAGFSGLRYLTYTRRLFF